MAIHTIRTMELSVGDRPIRPITADEAMAMASSGIIGTDERVELLHGVLTTVPQQDPPHAGLVQLLTRWLAVPLANGVCDVRVRLPMRVPDETSLPEPDIAVVSPENPLDDHPHTAFLVVEVAHTSLHVDLNVKTALYASANVPEYWVVDVNGQRLLRMAEPSGDEYTTRTTHKPPESVEPTAFTASPLDLAQLLEGL